MPIWKNRSGCCWAKMCMSVYFARSADSPTTEGFSAASVDRACPNGADAVRCPASAMLAIIAEVFGLALTGVGVAVVVMSVSFVGGGVVRGGVVQGGVGQCGAGEGPFVVVDAHEVRLLPGFQERHPGPDAGVADDDGGPVVGGREGVEGLDQGGDVVAVDPGGAPAECG